MKAVGQPDRARPATIVTHHGSLDDAPVLCRRSTSAPTA
jgi:hypothetical protein